MLVRIGRIGATRREKLYSVVTLKRRFPPSLLALLQCFNRFAASLVNGAHTIQLHSTVVAQLVNFFLRRYEEKAVFCAAFGIHRAVYFIQTLEAMFAASITAKKKKNRGAFLCNNCKITLNSGAEQQTSFVNVKRAVADHKWYVHISVEYTFTSNGHKDSGSDNKKHLVHESPVP